MSSYDSNDTGTDTLMMMDTAALPYTVAQQIADDYAALPQVVAVVLAGSVGAGAADAGSDIDLYVYTDALLPLAARRALVEKRAAHMALDNQFWELGDEWQESASAIAVDITYRSPAWIADQLDRLLLRHEASTGYSTCFWYNVLHSACLFDRSGWYAALQTRAQQPYPDALRRAIVAKNHPILRDLLFSAYSHQLEKALSRGDAVSVNHRVAALLASYFDIIFAVNRQPHPGEKKLLALIEARCDKRPAHMSRDVQHLLSAAGLMNGDLLTATHSLIDHLDELLAAEGLLPTKQV
ncbi:MAG: nucleotidyltransferase domain-containing protein [Anaerolineae bacterium]